MKLTYEFTTSFGTEKVTIEREVAEEDYMDARANLLLMRTLMKTVFKEKKEE